MITQSKSDRVAPHEEYLFSRLDDAGSLHRLHRTQCPCRATFFSCSPRVALNTDSMTDISCYVSLLLDLLHVLE